MTNKTLGDSVRIAKMVSEDYADIMAEFRTVIGSLIRSAREEAGLSQRELAELVGVTPAYISQIETKLTTPSVELAERMANVL